MAFGAKQVQKDQQVHHKSHRAVFAHELDFFVTDAKRQGSVWPRYFQLDEGVDGEVLDERENLDVAAQQGTSEKELARLQRVGKVLDILNDQSIKEEADNEAAMIVNKESVSADERAQRRRRHLFEDDGVPGESLRAKRARDLVSTAEEDSGASASEKRGPTATARRGRPEQRRRSLT